MGETEQEMRSFRLYQSIRFNRPIDKKRDIVSPGGYALKVKDSEGKERLVSFDFEYYEGTVDKEDPKVLHCMQKDPDADYEDTAAITAEMLRNVVGIEEWFIYTGESEKNMLILEEIFDAHFEILEDGWSKAPIEVSIHPTYNDGGCGETEATTHLSEKDVYYLKGYDKDADVYETICSTENQDRLCMIGNLIAAFQHRTDKFCRAMCRDGKEEPFDWFVGFDSDDNILYTFTGENSREFDPVKEEDKEEFIGQIIDIFEDFLETAGSEEDAVIVGKDYEQLKKALTKMAKNWKIFIP